MKLGFVTSILENASFEEMIDTASQLGFACVEVRSEEHTSELQSRE